MALGARTPWFAQRGSAHFAKRSYADTNRIRCNRGVLAPNAKLRALVVPHEPEPPAQAAPPAECEATCEHHRPVRLSWAKLLKRVLAAT